MHNYLIQSKTKGQIKLICPFQWDAATHQWKSKWDVIEYSPYPYTPENIDWLMTAIRENLSADMLAKVYLQGNANNPLYGHCYHSTQSIYYLMDTDCLVPMRGCDASGLLHWYLIDKDTNAIFDATEGQYNAFDYPPPYDNAKKTDWYSFKKSPIRKTLNLIQKVQPSSLRYITQNPFDDFNTLNNFL